VIPVAPGIAYHPGYWSAAEQAALVEELRAILKSAPLFTPTMPKTGKPFSVRMTNCGPLGWVSDREGYRYQAHHPLTGEAWPAMPAMLLDAWRALSGYAHDPEACLINYYGPDAKMGLHQDRDEEDFDAPIVSFSLGDTAMFRIGGAERGGKTTSLKLHSGDGIVFGGPARLVYHGIDRIFAGTSTLLGREGRVNLTLRRVKKP
jgi:alkylated DNA repair protein (DNA oxidative demethylase)